MDFYAIIQTLKSLRYIFSIHAWISKLKYGFNYYFRKPIRVVVFGCSGTGKSQFIQSLRNEAYKEQERTRLILPCRIILEDGYKLEIIDTPGHQSLEKARRDMCMDLVRKKVKGIINIVNFGYSETDQIDDNQVFKVGTNEVKAEYLRDNQKRELQQIEEWISFVDKKTKIKWVVTLINKADIWYNNKTNVFEYYENGEYANKLQELKHCCALYTFPYCCLISPFCDKPMLLEFGEKEKQKYQEDLKSNFLKLVRL